MSQNLRAGDGEGSEGEEGRFADYPLPLAAVFSVEGFVLSPAEKSLFAAARPFGFILFGRNCDSPRQLGKLVEDLRAAVGWPCPILIDQEGGRVARLKPPAWTAFPPARHYGEQIEKDRDSGTGILSRDMGAMARMLRESGIDANCAPVLDVLTPLTHQVIGDRAFSSSPAVVGEAGEVVSTAFLRHGVFPVIKHLPGHGRATLDSHHALPVVTEDIETLDATDFLPFRMAAQLPIAGGFWGMVAHVIYAAIDPDSPATLSKIVINKIIRERIGFDGLLFSDDLDMKALEKYGPIEERARESLQAGCDLALYCWAKRDVMEKMAAILPPLSAAGWERWQISLHQREACRRDNEGAAGIITT